jgi:hypothetical protein
VHPREVVRQALARNAAAVILAHNHPKSRNRLNRLRHSESRQAAYPWKYPHSDRLTPLSSRHSGLSGCVPFG